MWRQKTCPGDPDSDQSISDEEDYNVDLRDNCVSMCGRQDKEEGLQLQSRLDILRGTYDINYGREFSSSSTQKQSSVSCEDEVEVPDFPDEDNFMFSRRKASTCNTDDEAISDDEENVLLKVSVTSGVKTFHKDGVHNFLSGNQDVENSCSTVGKEAEAPIQSNEIAISSSSHSAYSKANKSCKGIKSKSRPKFSFHFQSHKDGNGVPSKVHEVPERLETANSREHSIAELFEDFYGEKPKKSEIVSAEVEDLHFYGECSVAELLDGLQDRTSLLKRNSKKYSRSRGEKIQVVKKSKSPLEDRAIVTEDLPERMSGSSDDEANHQNVKTAFPEMKRQTIADRFQEALGATSNDATALVTVQRTSGVGLFGKLQQVMQSEKLKDMNFLNLQSRASPNNPSCMDVRILSRYLDAKLIVCRVSSVKDIESIKWPEFNKTTVNDGRERTIIFNPRVCCDVDLEAGKSIRIHPPWKEVQVTEDGYCH
ncbi:uncharacterized protein LOC116116925 isoform X2 [Pistacia vera]|uniref:uncharacterized protein LOC116116925 isoform X2 n=1 Tax=Pistacia vera TaxID=55513 RepID=UPI0012637699|nr:uncharacterized protein LOC116116925 isoform X2 [Pistacia vera]